MRRDVRSKVEERQDEHCAAELGVIGMPQVQQRIFTEGDLTVVEDGEDAEEELMVREDMA